MKDAYQAQRFAEYYVLILQMCV